MGMKLAWGSSEVSLPLLHSFIFFWCLDSSLWSPQHNLFSPFPSTKSLEISTWLNVLYGSFWPVSHLLSKQGLGMWAGSQSDRSMHCGYKLPTGQEPKHSLGVDRIKQMVVAVMHVTQEEFSWMTSGKGKLLGEQNRGQVDCTDISLQTAACPDV